MNLGVQILAFVVIVSVMANYFGNRRIPILSSNIFTGFIILSFFNVVFEFSTLYTIFNIETVEPWVNRLCHQLFIGSLDFLLFFLFLYVEIKSHQQRRYTFFQIFIRIIPLAVSIGMVIFGELYYYVGDDGRYSYGPMSMTVFISVAVYVLLTIIVLVANRMHFGKKEMGNIVLGIIVWAAIAIYQFLHPTTLLSSAGVSLMTLFMYISFENPRDYTDFSMPDTFNNHAYEIVINEHIQSKKTFYVVSVAIVNNVEIQNIYGEQKLHSILYATRGYFPPEFGKTVYHPTDNSICLILTRPCSEALRGLQLRLGDIEQKCSEYADIRISCLECPKYANTQDMVNRAIAFVNTGLSGLQKNSLIEVDDEIIKKLNYRDDVKKVLQKAVEEDGFDVFYQPIYSTKKKKFISAEALVRLKDTETVGFVSPEVFIPIAEKSNMIEELGRIVFNKVCNFYSKKRLEDFGVEYIEVNLSGKQIVDSELPKVLNECLENNKLSAKRINLEITETAIVKAKDLMKKNMEYLTKEGFDFAMDDFGTGYSNLSGISNDSFNLVKLDKSLIWPCFDEDGEKARVILNATISMIHNLGKQIVAEGVETKAQVDYLTEKKVSYLQGYYFSKPISETKYMEFMRQNSKKVVMKTEKE